jgi:hypothetical protein
MLKNHVTTWSSVHMTRRPFTQKNNQVSIGFNRERVAADNYRRLHIRFGISMK